MRAGNVAVVSRWRRMRSAHRKPGEILRESGWTSRMAIPRRLEHAQTNGLVPPAGAGTSARVTGDTGTPGGGDGPPASAAARTHATRALADAA